jgi:GT2 family glycosyltransferase
MTPSRALVVYTLLNKYFPSNPLSVSYFQRRTNKEGVYEMQVPTLAAALIDAELFKKVGMFDESMFLYFEEYDLAKRLNKLGYRHYILPQAKVLHFWESSTKQINNRNHILEKSRFYYFTKHFGKVRATLIEAILRRNLRMLVVE